MDFIHLHNHSDYSILDGAITIDKLISKAIEMDMPGVALTDHGNMFGALEFYQKAQKAGIKPIIGEEFYIAPKSRFEKSGKENGNDPSNHLLLLAKNATGYKNLMKLSSIGYVEGFYYKPRIDLEILEKHKDGLICLSSCIKGEIPSLILRGKKEEASKYAGIYQELFGKEHFYLELQDHGLSEQKKANSELINISKSLEIPLIVTNDCHYPEQKDARSHDVLLCIQTGKTFEDENRMRFSSDQFFFKTPEQMHALFSDYPEALSNTCKILDMIDIKLSLGNAILPNFTVPDGYTLDSYLKHLVYKGATKRFNDNIPEDVKRRIEHELKVITSMHFSGYFLIVWDFINYAKSKKILVGPGRGSAAGSMISYCLGITSLNPIKYNLLFERFLNPDRNEMPDMDIDFCAERRDEVIEYVKEKYGGEDHVSQIITFNKMKAKAVIKDVARVLNIPYSESNQISKYITENSLDDVLQKSEEFNNFYKNSNKGKMLIDISLALEGVIRSAGKHAAGVVISKDPITEYVPLYRDSVDGSISSQYEKMSLESAGLVKMDILGVKNLTIIDKCLHLIENRRGEVIDINNIPLDDKSTFSLLQKAETCGVFQLESSGMQSILRKLGPTSFEEIIAIVALYRPGPLDSGMVDDYITRKKNPERIKYPHPTLEQILMDTLGVIVYQEQVMLISQIMGGFTLSEADTLRKAMSKKKPKEIDEMEEKFINGAKQKNIDNRISGEIFSMMKKFGRYGFNKSHSAAYAMVAYHTAYLKANYPFEYMTALLSTQQDNQSNIIKYIKDCWSSGIQILPPDVNYSGMDFLIEDKSIRFGLGAIKGIGEKAIQSIIDSRDRIEGFKTLQDFLANTDIVTINRGVIESLIKAGAFDSIYINRATLFASVDTLVETAKQLQMDKATGQGNLFEFNNDESTEVEFVNIDFNEVCEWDNHLILSFEKEVLGVYISSHPLADYETEIKALSCLSISELAENKDIGEASIIGIISNVNVKTSRNGNRFAIGNLEDLEGIIEAIFRPNILSKYEEILSSEDIIMVKGNIEFEEDNLRRIIVNEIQALRDFLNDSISAIHIRIIPEEIKETTIENLKSIIVDNSGTCPVYFHVSENGDKEKIINVHPSFNIMPSKKLINKLTDMIGNNAIRYSIRS
ncbi:MAG: DNA polymerase III subunit alpha [Spirochaetota bacterium]|nr:DNA polymerase III subunit alpha [Spirochaetota bacterium]